MHTPIDEKDRQKALVFFERGEDGESIETYSLAGDEALGGSVAPEYRILIRRTEEKSNDLATD